MTFCKQSSHGNKGHMAFVFFYSVKASSTFYINLTLLSENGPSTNQPNPYCKVKLDLLGIEPETYFECRSVNH